MKLISPGKSLRVIHFLVMAIAFSLAYTQEPIYNSPEYADGNQHTKFFHGLARAGFGFLNDDWLASTLDPLPVFTFLVEFTYRTIHSEYAFYIYYALLMGVYIYSLLGIVNYVYNLQESRAKYFVYLALFIALHTVNLEIGNFDTAWHLQSGVAQQYILGPVFQPCNFGAFILLSIWLFLRQRCIFAVVALAIAATFHPAYLFSVVVLTAAYVFCLIQKNINQALWVGGLSFLLVLPVFLYTYLTFGATSPELSEQATDIIVNFRIPYHSIPEVWLAEGRAQVQSIVVIIVLYLVRNTRLAALLFLPFITAFYLTFFQVVANNNTLAFLAPWRLSVFLVPLSTSLILAACVLFIFRLIKQVFVHKLLTGVSLATISALVIGGMSQQIDLFQYQGESTAMLDFVRQNRQPGQTYLVPPESQPLQKFRLYTGVPIFINQKSHPYKDTEVLEWYRRLMLAEQFYKAKDDRCSLLEDLSTQYSITHVVSESETSFNCSFLKKMYKDNYYQISKVL